MADRVPSLSTDQVAAFVELARHGSLRSAAATLHLTEQGVRNRLIALESRLGVTLYHKERGPRRRSPLTRQGEQFLPHALSLLDRARRLCDLFTAAGEQSAVHVAATQYLTTYVLIDAVRAFHRAHPGIRVRLSTRTERDIEDALRRDPDLTLGVAAPYDAGGDFVYRHLFSLDWGLVTPIGHPLGGRRDVTLADLADVPLILFERGSTGRQHILDAFHGASLSPRVDMEATTTAVIVQMVEAGLGVSIVPLMPNGAVTRGRKVRVRKLTGQIRLIHSGILTRRGDELDSAAEAFVRFLGPTTGPKAEGNSPPV
ncbi:LysR family transcriptional regulator [Fimbriiglobus ruber]|uniref:Putative LysR-family transcriptional regulator n=1 Tax=Fimbriiglobus ruber TaxID=1908690 RepID=A0A225DUM0_9BACT|nr:LysR family transcriptional regulator [Fimbriiglobus ruber]OWK43354.1 putative LysR-family transcriptional regulator [Fimbriiglobus ruber]